MEQGGSLMRMRRIGLSASSGGMRVKFLEMHRMMKLSRLTTTTLGKKPPGMLWMMEVTGLAMMILLFATHEEVGQDAKSRLRLRQSRPPSESLPI